ncbi:flavodoxin family protein [Ruminococcus sp.]|uniref:flavodoxin family protein n=1 Tax=Ruminococcus sp. TaxID=41978 RepID=UPI002873C95D|nr:flavodoxin family protein [Ruminococcus sp.]
MMKTAIVYYSMSGNTKTTAETVAQKLGAELIEIKPVKDYPDKGARKFIWGGMKAVMGEKPKLQPYSFDGSYDRIIFGTPVWASSFTPPIRSFIEENRAALNGKRFSVFVCYSGGGADKAIGKLRAFLAIEGFDAELILVDPKDRPNEENEQLIEAFCDKLK